jgi:hypothetical protein
MAREVAFWEMMLWPALGAGRLPSAYFRGRRFKRLIRITGRQCRFRKLSLNAGRPRLELGRSAMVNLTGI